MRFIMALHKFQARTCLILEVDLKKNLVELSDKNGLLLSKIFAETLIEYLQGYISENTNEEIDEENRKRLDERDAEMEKALSKKAYKNPPPCFVYLVKDTHRGCIKIGCTSNVKSRIEQIKVTNAGTEYLKHFDGRMDDEIALHKYFTQQGKRISGEWFSLEASDIEYIETYFNQNALNHA